VDLLDNGMPAVGLVRRDGVEPARPVRWGGGEERVEAPHVEQGGLPGGLLAFGVHVGDAAHDQPTGDAVGLLRRREGGERDLGDLRFADPRPGGVVEDRVRVLDRGPRAIVDARFTELSQVPISQHGRAPRRYGTLPRPTSSADRG
jgi:hypothetical protein